MNSKHPGAEYLKPMKAGETRNPKGFSKKSRERCDFKKWIEETCPKDPLLVFKTLSEGAKGTGRYRDINFVREYLDRLFGKVPQKSELSGAGGRPIEINILPFSQEAAEDTKKLVDKLRSES